MAWGTITANTTESAAVVREDSVHFDPPRSSILTLTHPLTRPYKPPRLFFAGRECGALIFSGDEYSTQPKRWSAAW